MPRWPAAALAASLLSLSGLASQAQAETSKAAAVAHSKAAAAPASPAGRIQAKRDWRQGSFMEIFVRGYQDSDGDGIGDLRGLTQRLDYLQDLGISGIWLMPITPSADRDHGYATTDYRGIEAQYGSMADFEELLRQAHRRGIGVIVDYVINHSAAEHPFFQEAAADRNSPYRDWFVWQDPAPTGWDIWGKNPWYANAAGGHYFATFGAPMPDFNLRNPAVVDYHRASMRFWLDKGLDGFRLDAVPHMIENDAVRWNDQPESRQLTLEFQQLIKSAPRRYSVCEATANPQAYADAKVCGSAFAFGLQYEVIKAAKGEPKAIQAVADYFKTAPLSMATMLSNHDIFAGQRLWDQMQGQTQPAKRYKLAAATYLLQPGIPFIYYGEEIGMAGVPGLEGDEPLRAPMSWTADAKGGFSPPDSSSSSPPFRPLAPNRLSHNAQTQAQDPDSILNFYKAMLQLRNQHPALTQGSYAQPRVQGQVLRFERKHGAERVLVAINYGEQKATLSLRELKPGTRLAPLYPAGAAWLSAKPLTLAPLSLQVYRLQTPKH
ncbi:alpha-amylase family glycosyl hydrolase [Paucibacter sp. KCTC 42545]|uniref:alpha-amylase family glycosyl hydrolase n=1 Tax=Paucibacter sp. KCTC 42545 TaxID=1768242 RepID=UPI000733A433|nr:alpha-amylase family glycosyl hydrolase [Paucibacter sp. KCTC 42545]ALT77524.1 hypothetical protein AT984_10305 [Paucibacter sp. KCTC 42545]